MSSIPGFFGGMAFLMIADFCRADVESDLLKKFQRQNQAAVNSLKQEVESLLAQAAGVMEIAPDKAAGLVREAGMKLQTATQLPRDQRADLVYRVQAQMAMVQSFLQSQQEKALAYQPDEKPINFDLRQIVPIGSSLARVEQQGIHLPLFNDQPAADKIGLMPNPGLAMQNHGFSPINPIRLATNRFPSGRSGKGYPVMGTSNGFKPPPTAVVSGNAFTMHPGSGARVKIKIPAQAAGSGHYTSYRPPVLLGLVSSPTMGQRPNGPPPMYSYLYPYFIPLEFSLRRY